MSSSIDPSIIEKLDAHHTSQVQAFIKFFKQRLQSVLKEVRFAFNDTKEMK